MATTKEAAKEPGAQKGRTGALKATRLSEAWPWLLLMLVGFICILAQAFGLFHEGIGKYLYISACAWAMAFGLIGLIGYIAGKRKSMKEEPGDSKPVAGEELHAEIEAGSPPEGEGKEGGRERGEGA